MASKKKQNLFNIKNILFSFIISIIIFLAALYYKQYFPLYLIHSITILLIMIIASIPFIIKKYKQQQNLIKLLLSCLSVILIFSGVTIYKHNDKLASDGEYIGIDISKWNDQINFQLAKQEIDFVIIRCGYTSLTNGTNTKEDPLFRQNIEQCKQLNIPYGIYYYSLARDTSQAQKEANFVNDLLAGDIPDLGVFIDLEDEQYQNDLSSEQLTNIATAFLSTIDDQNRKGIYANRYWWTTKLTDPSLNNYIKWIAHYQDDRTIDDGFTILQYSETGSVKGIDGNVDLNIINNKYWQD